MTLLTVHAVTLPPQAMTMVAPSGTTSTSDTVPVAGVPNPALVVSNTSGAARNLLINTPGNVYGAAVADISVPLPTNGTRVVRLPVDQADASGLIGVGVDNVTGVTYAAIAN